MTTRLAILDLDGTLIDSVEDIANAVNHGLSRAGLPRRSQEEIRGFVGDGAIVLLERAVGAHRDLLPIALEGWREHYAAHALDHTRPYKGIEELLAKAGRTLAVQTNKPGPMARQILQGLGLLERFAVVLGGGESPKKPDPAGVQVILDRLGARPEDTVFVGDSPVDVATALGAGLDLVAVTWGLSSREDLLRAGAVHLVDRVEELTPWLA